MHHRLHYIGESLREVGVLIAVSGPFYARFDNKEGARCS